jgi:hypothetical protein
MAYAQAVAAAFPGAPATASGYAAWRAARGEPAGPAVRLYATAALYIPGTGGGRAAHPGVGVANRVAGATPTAGGHSATHPGAGDPARLDRGHHHTTADWLTSGLIAPVTGPMDG